jgi:hypothetical protein
MIVTDERIALFVSNALQIALCPPYTCLGLEREGEIIAGVIVNGWEARNAHVTVAGRGWTREFIKAVGEYIFGQLRCLRMTITTPDPQVAEYAQRLGGEVEGVMRDYYGEGEDAFLVGILAKDWPLK